MKKQSLLNRAVKIAAVSMLTFGLFFNVGIDLEIGKYGVPSFKSISYGNVAFAQDEESAPGVGDPTVATSCRHTGNYRDRCPHSIYSVRNCLPKSIMDETPSNCGY